MSTYSAHEIVSPRSSMVSRSAAARVLLVSDDPRWRQACYRRFPISMETAWVSLLDSALAELDVQSFDVVVVDTSLPDAAPDRNLPILERMARRLPVIAVVHDDLIHAWALERRERVSLLRVPPEAGIEQQA
ncbi:MAG: hypothetical protein R3D03_24205, partial [Geminicoccaceae bacterium]